jgi:elongation factor G
LANYSIDKLRNVALVGHGGSGKTSLTEALLFACGHTTRLGKVDEGNAATDYDPDEIKHKFSLTTSMAPCEHKDTKINFLDTPGYADFIGEPIAALRVVETALLVVNAQAGVEVGHEKLWEVAGLEGIARAFVVNRLDAENTDFDQVLAQLRGTFGTAVAPLQLPIGSQHSFSGVVDLVSMKAITFKDGKAAEGDIPDDLAGAAESARETLSESVAEGDDELLEKYLESGEMSQEDLEKALSKAIVTGSCVPVFCASATHMIGSQPLLDAIVSYFPDPTARGTVVGEKPHGGGEEKRDLSPSAPLAALVWKSVADPFVGRLTYVRVFSGTLRAGTDVLDVRANKKERVGHILTMRGKNQTDLGELGAGDIGAIPKLPDAATNDTLCDPAKPIVLPRIEFPEPLAQVAVEPESKGDEDKLGTAINRLVEEDPTLRVRRDAEMHQTVLSGQGDIQLEVVMERLANKFGVKAKTVPAKIPYRETIKAKAEAQGRHKKQTGGRGQFGDAHLRVEPLPRSAGYEWEDKIFGGSIPRQFIPAVEKGVHEAMGHGPVAGYPVVDLKVTVYDGSSHPVDSSEMAFKMAGSIGFKAAVEKAQPTLLEPIMKMEVVVPEQYMGDVIGDLNSRRGRVEGTDPLAGAKTKVRASVPQAEVATYSATLRSITQGRGTFSLTFDHYAEVPPDAVKKIVEAAAREKEEEKK